MRILNNNLKDKSQIIYKDFTGKTTTKEKHAWTHNVKKILYDRKPYRCDQGCQTRESVQTHRVSVEWTSKLIRVWVHLIKIVLLKNNGRNSF